jgi:hypothetical protein
MGHIKCCALAEGSAQRRLEREFARNGCFLEMANAPMKDYQPPAQK